MQLAGAQKVALAYPLCLMNSLLNINLAHRASALIKRPGQEGGPGWHLQGGILQGSLVKEQGRSERTARNNNNNKLGMLEKRGSTRIGGASSVQPGRVQAFPPALHFSAGMTELQVSTQSCSPGTMWIRRSWSRIPHLCSSLCDPH